MRISRRTFLRAGGVSLALPWLEGIAGSAPEAAAPPMRMVCLCTPLGLHAPNFFPAAAGRDYAATPYLETLRDFRNDMTAIVVGAAIGLGAGLLIWLVDVVRGKTKTPDDDEEDGRDRRRRRDEEVEYDDRDRRQRRRDEQ